jgi:hypothetical protein
VSGEGAWSESPDQADYWAPLYHQDENAVKRNFFRRKMILLGYARLWENHQFSSSPLWLGRLIKDWRGPPGPSYKSTT